MTYYINKAKVKDNVDANVSADFLEDLNKKVKDIVERAEYRAKENNRVTVMEKDL